MEYGEPVRWEHKEADVALEVALTAPVVDPVASGALVGLALSDDDREYVEAWCVRIGRQAVSLSFRGTAALCVGHLARRFGTLRPDTVRLVHELAADKRVRAANPQVEDALDDVDRFAT